MSCSKILCVSMVLLFSSVGFSAQNTSAGPGPTAPISSSGFDPNFRNYRVDSTPLSQAELSQAIDQLGSYNRSNGYHNVIFSGRVKTEAFTNARGKTIPAQDSEMELMFAKNGDGKIYYFWKWTSTQLPGAAQRAANCVTEDTLKELNGYLNYKTEYVSEKIVHNDINAGESNKFVGFRAFDLDTITEVKPTVKVQGTVFMDCNPENNNYPGQRMPVMAVPGVKVYLVKNASSGQVIGFQFHVAATRGTYTLYHTREIDSN